MKTVLAIILALNTTIVFLPPFRYSQNDSDSSVTMNVREIKSDLYSEYLSLLDNNTDINQSSQEDDYPFQDIISYPYKEMNISVIETIKDEISAAILYDQHTNTYFYLEADYKDTNTATLVVNRNQYTIAIEGYNMYLVDNHNNVFQFVLSSDNGSLPNSIAQINKRDIKSVYASWIFLSSGLTRTETSYLAIIETIAYISGAVYDVFQHPLFGIISILAGYIVDSGNGYAWVTLYIKYDLYYRSDCTTYYKEHYYLYSSSSYSNASYIDQGDRYYHSVRPDYAGQNCLAYGY